MEVGGCAVGAFRHFGVDESATEVQRMSMQPRPVTVCV